MLRDLLTASVLSCLVACGGRSAPKTSSPAATGLRSYLKALRQDDPRAAYAMLAQDMRSSVSYKQFELMWKESKAERTLQARSLEEGLQGGDDLGERARVKFSDGKTASLHREGGQWRLESALLSRSHAGDPRDAVRILAEALRARDYDGVMGVLTKRRRDGIGRQVDQFVNSLLDHLGDEIAPIGKDRAELSWDDDEMRYKIVLYRDGDGWRVDDIHQHAAPSDPAKQEPKKGRAP